MCGIAGILNFGGRTVAPAAIEAMTNAIAHRGRDSAGIVVGGRDGILPVYPGIALGHRRLSVIDLSPHSAQPMFSSDRRFCIVYNGELYNYRPLREELAREGLQFATDSDTEVVLNAYIAWGTACLSSFNGMFAFAIWNDDSQSLFCARDALGIKPFYYALDRDGFRFASESQALVQGRANLAPLAVTSYFFSMYVPRHLSIYAGVEKLLPGHALLVHRDGCVDKTVWWQLPPTNIRQSSPAEAAERLQGLLDHAVQSQLQSDVPVGALLSGGFDSGMIVASAAGKCPLHTYSVGFDDGRQFNELPIARALAARYGTIHHERIITGNEVMTMLDAAIGRMSEPVADSAMVPTYCLSGMAAADGVKVLLSGTGGDEVFGGYSRYVASSWRRQLLYRLPASLRRLIGQALPGAGTFAARLLHPALDMVVYTGGSPALATQILPAGLDLHSFLGQLVAGIYPQAQPATPPLYEHMEFDLQVYLPDLLLMLLDQLTMAHTVEGRVPLLDVDLIAASYALAPELHANPRHAQTRMLMRRMAAGKLDERTFTARKQGFSGPVRSWIDSNRAIFRERVMACREVPGLERLQPDAWWKSGAEHNPYWAQEVFLLYCFTTWYQTHAGIHG
jgi:asparagine synthase (glutamine-hydrolysing)